MTTQNMVKITIQTYLEKSKSDADNFLFVVEVKNFGYILQDHELKVTEVMKWEVMERQNPQNSERAVS